MTRNHKGEQMNKIKKLDAYKCADGEIFVAEKDAIRHQKNICYCAIDTVMSDYNRENPDVCYPMLKTTLVPYMHSHAKELINALQFSI